MTGQHTTHDPRRLEQKHIGATRWRIGQEARPARWSTEVRAETEGNFPFRHRPILPGSQTVWGTGGRKDVRGVEPEDRGQWRETEESAHLEKPLIFIGTFPPLPNISPVVDLVLHVPLSLSPLTLQTWLSREQLRCPSSRPTGKSVSASRCDHWLIILPATAWTTMRVATKPITLT
jgi:hypothetical protein